MGIAESAGVLYNFFMNIKLKNGVMPEGRVDLPPSKSEAIRAALLLQLAGEDPARAVAGYAPPYCRDIACALSAVNGDVPYVGESAALMRMLIPVRLALRGGIELKAENSLLARGMRELEDCLGQSFARTNGGVAIGKKLEPGRYSIDCSRSSQFLSGLMIALPLLSGECGIIVENGLVSKPYADMTFDFVSRFGGRIERTDTGYITRPSRYRAPEDLRVTGDRSYAAVFEAMNLLGGRVELRGLSDATLQPDKAFLNMAGRDCDVTDCPDLLPILAVVASAKKGKTVIRGTARLRTKESDREKGSVALIRSLGGEAEIGDDEVTIIGTGRLRGGECSAMNDHRLVFAAAVSALICDSPVIVNGAECAAKSAPGFWDDIARLGIG